MALYKKIIFLPDWMIFLKIISIESMTSREIQNDFNFTWTHCSLMRKELEKKGWTTIRSVKKDNITTYKYMDITEEGKNIVLGINYLMEQMKINDEQLFAIRRRSKNESARDKK